MIRQLLPDWRDLADARALESAYLHCDPTHLRVNFISSLDGAVEIGGRSAPLGGPADRAAFMAMRAVADVVLVGAGTARAENYGRVRLDPQAQERRLARGQSPRPPLAVVSGRGDLDPTARMFEAGSDVIVLTTDEVAVTRPDLAAVASIEVCGDMRVDPLAALAALRRRGLGRVLCEGGPELTRTLIDAGLVDELCLTIAPLLAGPGHRLLSGEGPPPPGRFRLEGLLEGDGMLLARYDTRPRS